MSQTISRIPISVVHSLPTWLPLTSPWLFHQVHKAPKHVVSHIACITKANLDQFDISNLHCLGDHVFRCRWEVMLRKLRIRQHLPFLVDVVRNTNSAVVHSHWGDAAWLDMPSVQRTKAKHVVTFYGKDVNFLPIKNPRWIDRYGELFSHVDAVLCEGPHMAKCIMSLGCHKSKVHVHHLGVEVDRIAFKPRRWTPEEPLRILIAASFREKKGIPLAITALGRLKHDVKSLEITIIGDASADPRSVPEKQRILTAIRENGLVDCVRLMGYQPHAVMFREAYAHHVFLSPSLTAPDGDTEGGAPIALLDMAATGIPIVSSTHCDIPNLIVDGVTGLLAQEGDLENLIEKLQFLVGNPDRWESMALAGRLRVEQEFDVRVQSARLAELYVNLSA